MSGLTSVSSFQPGKLDDLPILAKNIYRLPTVLINKSILQFLDYQNTKILCILGQCAARFDTNEADKSTLKQVFRLTRLIVNEKDPKKLDALFHESIESEKWNIASRISNITLGLLVQRTPHPNLSAIALDQLTAFSHHKRWTSAAPILDACNNRFIQSNNSRHETSALIQAACHPEKNALDLVETVYHSTLPIEPTYWKDIALLFYLQNMEEKASKYLKKSDTNDLNIHVLSHETLLLVAQCGRWDLIDQLLPQYCQPYEYAEINLPISDRIAICQSIVRKAAWTNQWSVIGRMAKLVMQEPAWLRNAILGCVTEWKIQDLAKASRNQLAIVLRTGQCTLQQIILALKPSTTSSTKQGSTIGR